MMGLTLFGIGCIMTVVNNIVVILAYVDGFRRYWGEYMQRCFWVLPSQVSCTFELASFLYITQTFLQRNRQEVRPANSVGFELLRRKVRKSLRGNCCHTRGRLTFSLVRLFHLGRHKRFIVGTSLEGPCLSLHFYGRCEDDDQAWYPGAQRRASRRQWWLSE